MALTSCTLKLTANAYGASPSQLAAAMDKTRVPADLDWLALLGSTITSDTTNLVANGASRTIVLSIAQPPLVSSFKNNPPIGKIPFQGCIVSESDEDQAGRLGAFTVNLHYLDTSSGVHAENGIALKGKTPVTLTNTDHATLVALDIATSAGESNYGRLKIFSGVPQVPPVASSPAPGASFPTNPKPKPVPTGVCVAVLPQPVYRLLFTTADAARLKPLFRNYMRRRLWAALGIPILADDPVFA